MNRLYMAYHIPNQQCIRLQIRISFLHYVLSITGEILLDHESSNPILRRGLICTAIVNRG